VSTQVPSLVPGLAGIPAAESAVSFIDGQQGILEYRGHRIEVLAQRSNFEEVTWLLLHGELPTAEELTGFRAELASYRELPQGVVEMLSKLPADGHPMAALQAGYAALGMHCEGKLCARGDDIAQIIAATPSLVAAFARLRRGEEVIAPDSALDTAGNFLWMLRGEKPGEIEQHVLDTALVLHADHTMNASTFTARVVGSSEADPYTVCASAVGSLKGPLHGGANERVLAQLEGIDSPAAVKVWLDTQLHEKGKVMGFGHRVYKTKDPRATILQGLARELFEKTGTTPIYDVALALEAAVLERLGERGIYPNVDFFSGIVYQKLGIPTDIFTPIFAMSRVAGWLAHWHEQMADNRIFRPGQIFIGSHGAQYSEIDSRG
jgi:citrate synthase